MEEPTRYSSDKGAHRRSGLQRGWGQSKDTDCIFLEDMGTLGEKQQVAHSPFPAEIKTILSRRESVTERVE